MGLKAELESDVATIFKDAWSERDGSVVPDETTIKLSNDAVNLDATVLYADLDSSTAMVDTLTKYRAAAVYRTFLRCAAKIIKSEGGTITAYDGDRVMAVYLGATKNTSAVKTGLKLNWACKNVIQPAMDKRYSGNTYKLKHVVGIDTSRLFVARAGIRGSNDLVWIGRAANYAAKLSGLPADQPTWITDTVYGLLLKEAKYSSGTDMWSARTWTAMNNRTIYCSKYWWVLK